MVAPQSRIGVVFQSDIATKAWPLILMQTRQLRSQSLNFEVIPATPIASDFSSNTHGSTILYDQSGKSMPPISGANVCPYLRLGLSKEHQQHGFWTI